MTLHIANTFFEWELDHFPECTLYSAFHQHAVYLQLQFLPLLFASFEDSLLVTDLSLESYWKKQMHTFAHPNILLHDAKVNPHLKIESWGASRLIEQWAQKRGIPYEMPNWDSVRMVNSKVFSFSHSPSLPGAVLLYEYKQAMQWMDTIVGDKVLKSAFGVSGRGHLHIKPGTVSREKIEYFLKTEWNKGFPVIAEPWVERMLDFSTQWVIEKSGCISYVGATLCFNNERGCYRSTRVGKEENLFGKDIIFLEEHKHHALDLLYRIRKCGYFGHVGFDAMIYRMPNRKERILHPIVEINARKTMGWVAIRFREIYFPDHCIELVYTPSTSIVSKKIDSQFTINVCSS